jgi:hypothetical protein
VLCWSLPPPVELLGVEPASPPPRCAPPMCLPLPVRVCNVALSVIPTTFQTSGWLFPTVLFIVVGAWSGWASLYLAKGLQVGAVPHAVHCVHTFTACTHSCNAQRMWHAHTLPTLTAYSCSQHARDHVTRAHTQFGASHWIQSSHIPPPPFSPRGGDQMVTGNHEFGLGIEFSNAARQLFPRWGYLLMLVTLLFNFQTANISAIIISAQSMDSEWLCTHAKFGVEGWRGAGGGGGGARIASCVRVALSARDHPPPPPPPRPETHPHVHTVCLPPGTILRIFGKTCALVAVGHVADHTGHGPFQVSPAPQGGR